MMFKHSLTLTIQFFRKFKNLSKLSWTIIFNAENNEDIN